MAFAGGTGVLGDPYLIATVAQLKEVASYLSSHFKLTQNLDLASENPWTSLGTTSAPFTGVFDGNNKILNNLRIKTVNSGRVGGLFSRVYQGTVKNLVITNLTSVASNPVSPSPYMGAIAGLTQESTFQNCTITGEIRGAYRTVGGLAGRTEDCSLTRITTNILIERSLTDATAGDFYGGLTGISKRTSFYQCGSQVTILSGGGDLGGLIGYSDGDTVEQCYALGSIQGTATKIGGIAGLAIAGSLVGDPGVALFKDCYAQVAVSDTVPSVQEIAGFVGYNQLSALYTISLTFENCYSTGSVSPATFYGGGFAGSKPDKTFFNDCFYDSQTSGYLDTGKGEPRTTAQMKTESTFTGAGWDFDTVWKYRPGEYPILQWQSPPEPTIQQPPERDLLVRWQNNGSGKWSDWRKASLGEKGDTVMVKSLKGLGCYKTRKYQIVWYAAVPVTIAAIEERSKLGGENGTT